MIKFRRNTGQKEQVAVKRDSVMRFFALIFFHESSSLKPLKKTFHIFKKNRGDTVFASQGAPPLSTTTVAILLPTAANFADTGGAP